METIVIICAHRIEFYYRSRSKYATPTESEIEHVRSLLNDNYVEGELNMVKPINKKVKEFRGWWKIIGE
jgi:hypothetical protein